MFSAFLDEWLVLLYGPTQRVEGKRSGRTRFHCTHWHNTAPRVAMVSDKGGEWRGAERVWTLLLHLQKAGERRRILFTWNYSSQHVDQRFLRNVTAYLKCSRWIIWGDMAKNKRPLRKEQVPSCLDTLTNWRSSHQHDPPTLPKVEASTSSNDGAARDFSSLHALFPESRNNHDHSYVDSHFLH